MRRISILLTSLISLLLVSTSCSDDTIMRKKVTGKAGEVIVVVPTSTWEGEVGLAIQKVLSQAQVSLPQEEPIFDLIDVPPSAFKDIFKTSRNIILVDISSTTDSSKVVFREDMYAWPQAVVELDAKTDEDLISLFNENSDQIAGFLLRAERNRLIMNYNEFYDRAAKNIIKDEFDIGVNLAPGFVVAEQADNFAWFRYDTPNITQGIMIYSFPYTSEEMLTQKYLLQVRDSLYKEYVEGPSPGSYPTTEPLINPVFNTFRLNNNYATEMRGLWKMENDFMGGPFINIAVLDSLNQRVIMLDGFVYAPNSNKRNYLRQVEAMARTLVLPDEEENNEIPNDNSNAAISMNSSK